MTDNNQSSQRPVGPCQAVCKYDDEDVCIGCFRRKEDIENWFFLDDARKWEIIHEVKPKIEARLNRSTKKSKTGK